MKLIIYVYLYHLIFTRCERHTSQKYVVKAFKVKAVISTDKNHELG